MRMIVFFDLPVLTSKQRRDYRDFLEILIEIRFFDASGIRLLQTCSNPVVADVLQTSIRNNKPEERIGSSIARHRKTILKNGIYWLEKIIHKY